MLLKTAFQNGEKLKYTGRMKFYSVILLLLMCVLTFLILSRKDISGTILRTEGMLYQERGIDSISNLYTIKLSNKTADNLVLNFKVENYPDARIQLIGNENLKFKAESQGSGSFFIIMPNKNIKSRSTKLKIGIYHNDVKINEKSTTFLGPIN